MSALRQRADLLVMAQALAPSRQAAQAMIMAGQILRWPSAQRIDKPGTQLPLDARLVRRGAPPPFVSRAGQKLQAALAHFDLSPKGWRCVDVGASTGGFTDCLLQAGAAHVVAVDVGHNQLVWQLRQHPQVTSIEGCNVRHAGAEVVGEPCQLASIDVSFISLTQILPAVLRWLVPGATILMLIKPQFEAGRAAVGKGGLVRCAKARAAAVMAVQQWCQQAGLSCLEPMASPVLGATGNQEYLLLARLPEACRPTRGAPTVQMTALG